MEKFGICLVRYLVIPEHVRMFLYPQPCGCEHSTDVSFDFPTAKAMGHPSVQNLTRHDAACRGWATRASAGV